MKKMLFTLFTIVCAVQLYGMNEQPKTEELNPDLWKNLPKDLKPIIMLAFAQSGDNLDEAIKNIHKASVLNKPLNRLLNEQYGNVKNFTALVNILRNKSKNTPAQEIAEKFNTDAAKKYIDVNNRLMNAINKGLLEEVIKLINQENADPNYSSYKKGFRGTILYDSTFYSAKNRAIYERPNAIEILRFLLEKGMDPNLKVGQHEEFQLVGIGREATGDIPEEVTALLKQYSQK